MRKRILAILTAASMFVCVAPAYVGACEGSHQTGLDHRNSEAQTNGQAGDRQLDAISRVDVDNDSARDSHTAPGWLQGGNWTAPTTTTTTTTTAPVVMRPVPVTTVP
jgi:hypothetical protein